MNRDYGHSSGSTHTTGLPDDEPLAPDALRQADCGRLEPLIDSLTRQLSQWLSQSRADKTAAPRIGLFGGLGQGKSTVLKSVIARLAEDEGIWRRIGNALFGSRLARFDVSYFKADDLEWRFLTAVLWRRILGNLAWMLPLLVFVLGIFFAGWQVAKDWSFEQWLSQPWQVAFHWAYGASTSKLIQFAPVAVVLIALASRAHKAFGSVNLGAGLYVSHRDWLTHRIAQFCSALPRVVIVDDLDRAKVEQQRAFLRAMTRFSGRMHFAVVVSLDESELLESVRDPEAPAELLRKTIAKELRLPDRSAEDIALLAVVAAHDAAHWNKSTPALARALNEPLFVADFIRVLLLLPPPVSPRLVKRLLADTLLAAEQRKVTDVTLVTALLRLQGLYVFFPMLHGLTSELREVLERNQSAPFAAFLLGRCGTEKNQKVMAAAIRYFERTRMMQPAHGEGWFDLVSALSDHRKTTPSHVEAKTEAAVPKFRLAEGVRPPGSPVVEFYRLFSEAIGHWAAGYEKPNFRPRFEKREEMVDGKKLSWDEVGLELLGRDLSVRWYRLDRYPANWRGDVERDTSSTSATFYAHVWFMWIVHGVTRDAARRLRGYNAAREWIDNDLSGDEPQQRYFRSALLRERVADAEYWAQLNASERETLLKEAQGQPQLVTLAAISGADFGLVSQCIPLKQDERALARWLVNMNVGDVLPAQKTSNSADLANLPTFWPPLVPQSRTAEAWMMTLKSHLIFWANHGAIKVVPHTLRAGWREACPLLSSAQRVRLLHALAMPSADVDGDAIAARLMMWRDQVCGGQSIGSKLHLLTGEDDALTLDTWARELGIEQRAIAVVWHLLEGGTLNQQTATGLREGVSYALAKFAPGLFKNAGAIDAIRGVKCAKDFLVPLVTSWNLPIPSGGILGGAPTSGNLAELVRAVLLEHPNSEQIFDALRWPQNIVPLNIED